jgi:endogenous inhibitor of DNA gyrase (YacG/DUF329 family)
VNNVVKTVPCPTCGKPSVWRQDNAFRPFCCERCKLIDLGEWASEGYSVPVIEQDNFIFPEDESV